MSPHSCPSFLSHSSPFFSHLGKKEKISSPSVSHLLKGFDTKKALEKLSEIEEKASFDTTPDIDTLYEWGNIVRNQKLARYNLIDASYKNDIREIVWIKLEVRREKACEEARVMQDIANQAAAKYSSAVKYLHAKSLEADIVAKNSIDTAIEAKKESDGAFICLKIAYKLAKTADENLASIIEYL